MLDSIILSGFVVGLVASMPPGPVTVLCIQRTLSCNRRSGFVSGLGATVADLIFAIVAFFSVAVVVRLVEDNMMAVKIVAGLVVVGIGLKVLFSNPVIQIRRNRAGKTNLWHDFLTVFAVTIANPAYILVYIFLFAAFGLNHSSVSILQSSLMLGGVLIGSAAWWFVLSMLASLLRRGGFRPRHLLWINRISGTAIIVLGIFVVTSAFFYTPLDGMLH